MSKVIVYTEGRQVKVVHPSPKCDWTLKKIAKKCVPSGIEYRITEASNLPARRV